MSIRLLSAAWDLDIGSTEKMVLMSLCDHANDEGVCWPSVATIMRKTSKSERTVQTALKWLKEQGYFEIEGRNGTSPKYILDPSKILSAHESPIRHYVYRTICDETGEYYIGARSCQCDPESDPYVGSGKWISEAKAKGLGLRKEILAALSSREELAAAERNAVAEIWGDPYCRNAKVPTPGTLTPANLAPRKSRTPQKLRQTPAKSAPKPSRTSIPPVSANADTPPDENSEALKPEHVVEAWNDTASRIGLAKVVRLTDARRKRLRTMIAQHPPDDFAAALDAIERSPFCRGEKTDWKADFDFFLQSKSFTKLLEGAYG